MPDRIRKAGKLEALSQQGTLNPRPQDVTHELFQNSNFFDSRDLVQVKYEMLRQVRVENQSVSQSAKAFGFSRPSFYQARSTFQQTGMAGLIPQKRGPRHAHKLTPEVLKFLRQARVAQPSLRFQELAQRVKERFGVLVHPRSIERQLLRQKKRR
jgi:transposase